MATHQAHNTTKSHFKHPSSSTPSGIKDMRKPKKKTGKHALSKAKPGTRRFAAWKKSSIPFVPASTLPQVALCCPTCGVEATCGDIGSCLHQRPCDARILLSEAEARFAVFKSKLQLLALSRRPQTTTTSISLATARVSRPSSFEIHPLGNSTAHPLPGATKKGAFEKAYEQWRQRQESAVAQSLLRNHTCEIRQIHSEAQSAGNGKEDKEKEAAKGLLLPPPVSAAKGLLLPPPLSAAKQSEVVKEEAALDSAPTKQAQEETDLLVVLSKQYQAAQALLVQLVTSNWRKLRVTDTLQKQAEKGPFTAQALHQAHQTLFLKSSQATSSRSGKLRSVGVRCGAVHFMPPAQVPAAISSFLFRLNQLVLSALGGPSSSPFSRTPAQSALSLQAVLEAAGYALSELVRLHPYTDGNGRMSRLVSDTILSLAGLPWQESCFAGGVVSGQADGGSFEERKRGRADYVRLVRTSHVRRHTGSLAGLLLTRVLRSLRGVQQLEESLIAQEKQESHVRAYREAKKEERCGICLEGLDRNTVSTSCCGAVFDMTCLAGWLKQNPSCPHCRAELPFSSAAAGLGGEGEEGEDGAYSEEHTRRMLHRLYHEYHDHGVSAGVMRFHHHPFDVQAFIGFFPAEDDDDGGNEEEKGELHRLISELRVPRAGTTEQQSFMDLLIRTQLTAEAEAQASGAETDTTTTLDLTTTTTTTTTTTAIAPDASDPGPASDERLASEEAKGPWTRRERLNFLFEKGLEEEAARERAAREWAEEEEARAEAALAEAAARWTTKGKARRW